MKSDKSTEGNLAEGGTSAVHGPTGRTASGAEPIAWRSRGYGQYKTGQPGPWGYRTGADRPKLNDPSCCDCEPLYAAPPTSLLREVMEALEATKEKDELGRSPDVHWESLRDVRRACDAKRDAALVKLRETLSE